jgi:hypothetical protein
MSYRAHTQASTPGILAGLIAVLTLLVLPSAAHAASGKLKIGRSSSRPDALLMAWSGAVRPGMAKAIEAAFDKHKDEFKTIEFTISSGGGSVREGERVIHVLQNIKKTHRLYTFVRAGKRCGSMCVFIYVQGQKRFAAPSSMWLFHEVSRADKQTRKIYELDRPQWEMLIDRYWIPAGVNPEWIKTMKEHTFEMDYFQSGQNLLQDDSGIVHKPLSDELRRKVVPRSPP